MTGLNRRVWLRGAGAAGLLGALQGGVRESGAAVPHFAPRARRVVYLFQSGGPSQVDLWDYKPGLRRLHGTDLPASVKGTRPPRKGKTCTGSTWTARTSTPA